MSYQLGRMIDKQFHSIRLVLKIILLIDIYVNDILLNSSKDTSIPTYLIPGYAESLSTLSNLSLITAIWITCNLIEICYLYAHTQNRVFPKEEKSALEDGFLTRTWVELVSQFIILLLWIGHWRDVDLIVTSLSAYISGELVYLPMTYHLIYLCLITLNLHSTTSIYTYARSEGNGGLGRSFWGRRNGWWVIQDEEERGTSVGSIIGVSEKDVGYRN